ncbi:hypothetical protein BW898_08590 [Bacillus cereus]|nr:hypothetical protein BW898_08590 [Bacillus cereus]
MARSECEVDGASDLEAFFASWEEAKPPNTLATVARLNKKRKWLAHNARRSHSFLTCAFSFSS